MATILSTPTTITVRGVGTSTLSSVASSMAPGSWAQIAVPNQNEMLGVGNVTGSMLPYCNSMPWNPKSKMIEIIGMDHGWPALRHVRYDDATNLFDLAAADAGIGQAHGYDHNAVNPYTGDLYSRIYGGFTGSIKVSRKAYGAGSFTSLPPASGLEQVSIGACWWSGSFTGVGAQGAFMVFNSGNSVGNADDGQIVAFDPLANAWVFSKTGMAPNYGSGSTYNSVMEYSARKNVAVYGGGNVASTRLWRLDSNGTAAAMPNTPGSTNVGIQNGMLIDEPVTGNFLLLSAGQFWELDPTGSGTWRQLTGSRTPPAGVGIPGPPTIDNMTCASVPDYGVVVFIKQTNQGGGTFYVYKHA